MPFLFTNRTAKDFNYVVSSVDMLAFPVSFFYGFTLHSDKRAELRSDLSVGIFTAVMFHVLAFCSMTF
jgi:hypothetical protein